MKDQGAFFKGGDKRMRKYILPLIFASMWLMTTPVYAAEPVDAIVPVSCTAEGSAESFAVSIQGDSGFKASPERLELKNGESKDFTISINLPGDYKYKIYQEKGTEKNTEYDSNIYYAEVFVTEGEDGKLNADTDVFTNGSSEKSAECEFINKITKETEQKGNGNPSGGSSSNGGLATQKGSSSDAPTVKTGVETNELMYVEIGLIGMVVAAIAVRKRNKKRR